MNKNQLANKIWASANKMRSKIEANEYKDYILGFIFYKFLSEQELKFLIAEGLTEKEFAEEITEEHPENVDLLQNRIGYFIAYENLYSTWLGAGHDFSVANVRDALSAFNRLVSPSHKKVFEGIFDTLQDGLKNLGGTEGEQTKAVRNLLNLIKDIPMNGRQDYDVLGFIYEYLISQFAANAGKKAGEFYTPHEVSLLMSKIVAHHLRNRQTISIYDPTSGSGSLLINIGKSVARHIAGTDKVKYYAQELKKNTFNLTRMNLVMRGIIPDNIVARNGDTLEHDWPYFEDGDREGTYHCLHVDAVVSNPPYSQPWTPPRKSKTGIQIKIDPRFEYGIAPKGKADYAFLLHDLYHLKSDGIMTIVLPHGVLFRGEPGDNSEGSIRQKLVENNHIDTIIGLPADIFFGTGIPTIVMVLRKDRTDNGVLIIDASKGFKKEGKKNKLRASDIKRIVDTYIERQDVPKFSRLVSKDEIRQNNYNLNIPRYVNSSDAPETWDMYGIMFGGVPKSELAPFKPYFDAFQGLEQDLFTETDTPYTQVKVPDIGQAVKNHPSVARFAADYNDAFSALEQFLKERLIGQMEQLNIAEEEEHITRHIFDSLQNVPLVDRFEAYQLFADKWATIAQDLEVIQSEGFEATRMVDPNMVVKKKDDKEYEVQEGWMGRILPFELVQTTHMKKEWTALRSMEQRLEQATADMDATFDELDEEERADVANDDGTMSIKEVERRLAELLADVETEEITALEEYLLCTRKKEKQDFIATHTEVDWQRMESAKNGTYAAKAIRERIASLRESYPFEEESTEAKLIKIAALSAEVKRVKTDIKSAAATLHEHTKTKIEKGLTDDDVRELLSQKWIRTLSEHLMQLPHTVVDDFSHQLSELTHKYDTTLVDVERDIREASESLAGMIDELTGSEYDMAALAEFKRLLVNA
jgi:type I restriction enzyme M protein